LPWMSATLEVALGGLWFEANAEKNGRYYLKNKLKQKRTGLWLKWWSFV
jgi:hypothetical protein